MTHPPSTTKSGLSWWFKLPAAGAALLVLAAICMLLLDNAATSRWDRYSDTLRAGGQPLTVQDLDDTLPPIPLGETVAKVLHRFSSQFMNFSASSPGGDILVFGRGAPKVDFFEGFPRNTIEPSREFLEQHQRLLTGLSSIRDLPPGRFKITHSANPFYTLLPHIPLTRRSVQLLFLSGIMNVCDKRLDVAIDASERMIIVSTPLQEEFFLISALQHARNCEDALLLAEGILKSGEVSGGALQQLQDRLRNTLNAMTLTKGFQSERASFVRVCDAMVSGDVSIAQMNDMLVSMQRKPLPTWIATSTIRENQLLGTHLFTKYVEAGDNHEALFAASEEIKAAISNLDWKLGLAAALVYRLGGGIERYFVSLARMRCAYLCLGAERYRLETGGLPNSLDELIPEYADNIPADPFADKPMRFRITKQGIVIYSIGPNGKDDRGIVTISSRIRDILDVGFRLWKPEHRGLLLIDAPVEED